MIGKADIDFSLLVNDSVQYDNLDIAQKVHNLFHLNDTLVLYPILDCICRKLTLDIEEKELIVAYIDYTTPWKNDFPLKEKYTPLLGLKSDIEYFDFNDEFSLRGFTDDLKTVFNNTTGFTFTNEYSTRELCESTHMVRWKKQFARKDKPYRDDHQRDLYLLIMSLRICNTSEVVAKFSFHNVIKRISRFGNGGYWHFETSKPYSFGDPVEFSREDLESASEMFNKLLTLKGNNGFKSIFNVVVNRYLSSLSRPSPEDSVIDLTICLESLLLFGLRDELTFRLSLRGAVLLKDRIPTDTKKILKEMYDDRSKIVHEGKLLSELRGDQSRNRMQEYRLVTEQIIKAYISKSDKFESIDTVNQYLDNLCLNSARTASNFD